jgi:hypothetical protein
MEMARFAVIGSFQGFTRWHTADSLLQSVQSCVSVYISPSYWKTTWIMPVPFLSLMKCTWSICITCMTIFNKNGSFTFIYSYVMKILVLPCRCSTVWQWFTYAYLFLLHLSYVVVILQACSGRKEGLRAAGLDSCRLWKTWHLNGVVIDSSTCSVWCNIEVGGSNVND